MNIVFCNVGEDLCENIPNKKNPLLNGNYSKRETDSTFSIANDEVIKACSKIKKSNGSGNDRISSQFLKVVLGSFACLTLHTVSVRRLHP